MKLHELSPVPGSRKKKKRLGQGLGSGQGKTAGKGRRPARALISEPTSKADRCRSRAVYLSAASATSVSQ